MIDVTRKPTEHEIHMKAAHASAVMALLTKETMSKNEETNEETIDYAIEAVNEMLNDLRIMCEVREDYSSYKDYLPKLAIKSN